MDANKYFDSGELENLLDQLDTVPFEDEDMSEEMKASQRRCEEILKKHDQNKKKKKRRGI